jgi:hypothetical protein
LSFRFLNIIIFIIIKSINIKNSIIYVVVVVVIIIIIIKIINKFEKNYYQYWKTSIFFIWSEKLLLLLLLNFKKQLWLSKKNQNVFFERLKIKNFGKQV